MIRIVSLFQIPNKSCNKVLRAMSSKAFTETKIKIDDVNINYVKAGSGQKAVILMPGALGSAKTDFAPQVELLPDILPGYTIIAWDPQGYGKSLPPRRRWGIDFFHNDVRYAHQLMQRLSFDKYSIAGWSDGGITGIIQAAKYPEAVESLIIWGSNAYIHPDEVKIYNSIRDVNKWSEKMRKPMEEVYGKEEFPRLWSEWIDAMLEIYEKNNGNICKELLEKIKCPTLILHGEKDPMIMAEHIPYLMKNINGATLHTFPDGKHNIHLRYASDFNKIVANFLEKSSKL